MKLETLYKTAKSGAIQVMNIEVINNIYTVTWGQKDGKMQTKDTTCKGKNIGKKNETTDAAQAQLEAIAYHAKKVKAGYSTDSTAPVTVSLPMKIQTYSKHFKKIIFPCYISPKLNGVNATYKLTGNTLELLSRGGEQYPLIDQQVDHIKRIMSDLGTDEINGEIYIHGEALQDITGAVKKYRDLSDKLVFHIFDLPNIAGNYADRAKAMYRIVDSNYVKVVPVFTASSHEHLDEIHDSYVDQGYEGLIARNSKGLYVHNTRSYDVQKLKKAVDEEFLVVNYDTDKNGHTVFVCQINTDNPDGTRNTFKVKLKGTNEERLTMTKVAFTLEGKWLKVEYEMLSKDGIPLKPVGIMFRECDTNGNPLE